MTRRTDDEICGKYEHRSRRRTGETVVIKVELRPDHQFTYTQDRTRNETTNKKETTQIHEIGKIIESNQDGGSGSSDGVVGGLGEDRL